MKTIGFKHIVAGAFLLLLWCVIANQTFNIFHTEPLKGYFAKPENIHINIYNWADGTYAVKKEDYIKNTFSLRPFFVRVYGQLKYSLFHTSTNHNVIIGKENYMYERIYIDAWNGDNYVGEEQIKTRIKLLKELQDTLQQRGIYIFVVFAPGKSSFYPEYIPDKLIKPHKQTNYETYIKCCRESGINYLDFVAWFNTMKDTARYALFPRCGVHWSNYGEFIAFDSIVSYLNANAGLDIATLKLNSIELSATPRMRDYDLGDALNIFTLLTHDTLAYPNYSVSDTQKNKPKLLSVADSYYYQMYYQMSPQVFSDADFWYYFNDLYNLDKPTRHISDVNFKDFILSKKVICLMYNYSALTNFGNGFIEAAHKEFVDTNTINYKPQ